MRAAAARRADWTNRRLLGYAAPVSATEHLSSRSAAILRSVIAIIRPRGHGFDQPIDDDVLAEIDRTVPFMPRPLQLLFPLGLRLLEWGPLVFAARPTRLSRLPREEALALCERWLHSRLKPLRMLMLGVRALVYLAFFQHPAVVGSMGVRWDVRMAETVRLRAETLDSAAYGYPRGHARHG